MTSNRPATLGPQTPMKAAVLGMDDYTPQAKAYWWTTTLVGAAALGLALLDVSHLDGAVMLQVAFGAAIAALTGLFPVRIPGTKTSLAGAELFIFLLLLVYGPAAATIAAAAEAAVGSFRTSKRWTSRIGSPTMAALAMFACGAAFTLATSAARIEGVLSNSWLFVALFTFAIGYFACSALLMASLIALKNGEAVNMRRILSANSWIGLAYLASAAIAGLIYIYVGSFVTPALLAAVPIIAMFLATINARFRQSEAAERRVAELQESEARLRSAFSHAAVGMVLVSRAGRILQANDAFAALLGRTTAECTGIELWKLAHRDDADSLWAELRGMLDGAVSARATEHRFQHATGHEVWISLNTSLFSEGLSITVTASVAPGARRPRGTA
ncbi:MAG TPA: PAS domain S-box protein [Gemmatimonadales bacterium]|nr:PAS domain S-box protein [Gemmatimonadales bacterium]